MSVDNRNGLDVERELKWEVRGVACLYETNDT
jgi:hypothetical protein